MTRLLQYLFERGETYKLITDEQEFKNMDFEHLAFNSAKKRSRYSVVIFWVVLFRPGIFILEYH